MSWSDERVLYCDEWLLIVNKPEGLLSVPGRGPEGADCLIARLQTRWPDALAVHRLDMATSGVMVFARGVEAHRRMSMAFERRTVGKRYVAIVSGSPPAVEGWSEIDLPLAVDWANRPRQRVDHMNGRPSRTRWRILGPAGGAWGTGTRLALEPVTGRSHQLRVHLMSIGHPIPGDPFYAPPALAAASPRLLLHAESLNLLHPADGRPMGWQVPTPF